jgi:nucleoside-diphosphate-sugar epimerase
LEKFTEKIKGCLTYHSFLESAYGLSKAIKEELCRRATRRHGIRTICLRFCWVWFPKTYARRKETIDNEYLLNIKRMWGYVDVRDVAQACRLAVESENIMSESFFITADDTFADESTIEIIRRDYPVVKNVSDDYLIDSHKSLFDNSKAKKFLGYHPQQSWRESV